MSFRTHSHIVKRIKFKQWDWTESCADSRLCSLYLSMNVSEEIVFIVTNWTRHNLLVPFLYVKIAIFDCLKNIWRKKKESHNSFRYSIYIIKFIDGLTLSQYIIVGITEWIPNYLVLMGIHDARKIRQTGEKYIKFWISKINLVHIYKRRTPIKTQKLWFTSPIL